MALLDDLAGLIVLRSIVRGKALVEVVTEVVQGPALLHVHVTTQIQTLRIITTVYMSVVVGWRHRHNLHLILASASSSSSVVSTNLLGVEVPLIVLEVNPLGPVLHQVLSVHTFNPEGHIAATRQRLWLETWWPSS